jgi:hypothetical protein
VPEAGAFGAENAVEYQGAYGNGAVAGMAGVEGAGVEESVGAEREQREGECAGEGLADRDPALAARVDAALAGGIASGNDAGAWSDVVPASHRSAVDTKVFGLSSLCDFLLDAVSDAEACLKDGDDEGFAECVYVLEQLSEKTLVATQLVEAYRQFYEGTDLTSLAMTGRSLGEHIDALADFERLHQEAVEATQQLADAKSAIGQALVDIAEVNLQGMLQTALAVLMDTVIIPGSVVCGPGAPVCATMAVLGGAAADMAIDDALGTEPQGVAEGLLGVVGAADTTKSAVEAAKTAASLMDGPDVAAKFVPGLGQALTAIDCVREAKEAHKAILQAIADAFGAVEELQRIGEESERLREEALGSVVKTLEELPDSLKVAAALADSAAAEIADIESAHGGNLYDPV